MQLFQITWTIEVEADTPLAAAREALRCQRDPYNMATEFEVTYANEGRVVTEEIDLGYDNPFGWPEATIEGNEVCCGHCGSKDTRYLEDAGRYSFMWAEHGTAYSQKTALTTDYEGENPRVWCAECSKESTLPDPFELLEPPKHTTPKEVPDAREIQGQLGG
jgi:hypothetical protein